MRFLRSSWKTFLVALGGFLLGAVLFHSPSVKAQGQNVVSVSKGYLGTGHVSLDAGAKVVGFSCVQNSNREPECYVASVGK
jgi:hypothetical protein